MYQSPTCPRSVSGEWDREDAGRRRTTQSTGVSTSQCTEQLAAVRLASVGASTEVVLASREKLAPADLCVYLHFSHRTTKAPQSARAARPSARDTSNLLQEYVQFKK